MLGKINNKLPVLKEEVAVYSYNILALLYDEIRIIIKVGFDTLLL